MEADSILLANIFSGLSHGVRELVVPAESDLAIHLEFFNLGEHEVNNICAAFSQLRKLKLNLANTTLEDEWAWHDRRPSDALKRASNLEILMIKGDVEYIDRYEYSLYGYETTAFAMLFSGCTFQNLHSLYLENVSASAGQFKRLVRGTPNLQTLVVEACDLNYGLWRGVASFLRARRTHGLTTVSLNKLSYGFDIVFPRHHHWVRCLPVLAYFLKGFLVLTLNPLAVQCV